MLTLCQPEGPLHWTRSFVCALLLCAGSLVSHASVPRPDTRVAPPACADFLAKLGQKPKALEFVGCKRVRLFGVAALQSDYRVKGTFAGPVESHFVKTAGMPRLRFICCGWESVPLDVLAQRTYGLYVAGDRSYAVSMVSSQTLINQRSALHTVDHFNVTVVLYLAQP
jgi:Domian of unknown function (DUF4952)